MCGDPDWTDRQDMAEEAYNTERECRLQNEAEERREMMNLREKKLRLEKKNKLLKEEIELLKRRRGDKSKVR